MRRGDVRWGSLRDPVGSEPGYRRPVLIIPSDRKAQFSIRINDQWRVCFVWTDQGAMEIEVVDYH